jgi:hypothetical protein
MECCVRTSGSDYICYTHDTQGRGWQPRVRGVLDARFEKDPETGVARVYVLTMGKTRYDEIVTNGVPDGWPERYASKIPREGRHYRLLGSAASFGMKNF